MNILAPDQILPAQVAVARWKQLIERFARAVVRIGITRREIVINPKCRVFRNRRTLSANSGRVHSGTVVDPVELTALNCPFKVPEPTFTRPFATRTERMCQIISGGPGNRLHESIRRIVFVNHDVIEVQRLIFDAMVIRKDASELAIQIGAIELVWTNWDYGPHPETIDIAIGTAPEYIRTFKRAAHIRPIR